MAGRSEKELREAVVHIAYERVALDLAVRDFLHPPGQRSFDLEAALVHARNLTDFFWNKTSHLDGVYAVDYDLAWSTGSGSQRPSMHYPAMNAQLAHISIKRGTSGNPKDFAKEIKGIAADLVDVWNRWRLHLNGTQWAPLLDAAVADWQAKAAPRP